MQKNKTEKLVHVYLIWIHVRSILETEDYPGISDDYINYDENSQTYLYAWTKKEEYAKEFMKERDKSIFTVTEKDVKKPVLSERSVLDIKLAYRSYVTTKPDNKGVIRKTIAHVLSTRYEYKLCKLNYTDAPFLQLIEYSFDELGNLMNLNIKGEDAITDFTNIFRNEIQEALNILRFRDVVLDYTEIYGERLPYKLVDIDEFGVFCKLFLNTYERIS